MAQGTQDVKRMENSNDKPRAKQRSYSEPHDEFVQLCALSISGDLTMKSRSNYMYTLKFVASAETL